LRDVGIVVIVGGPQVRTGSHRQFTLLARRVAAAGWPTLRFDARGMGDSTGEPRDFEQISPDIACAIDALVAHAPGVRRVVLWGLCDAASAALLYLHEHPDPRVAGLCLLNPWVRSAASLARTHVKHYYGARLLQPSFWHKLASGRVGFDALRGLVRSVGAARAEPARGSYQTRMAAAWRAFAGPLLLVLSGRDYTAREFTEYTSSAPQWRGLLTLPGVTTLQLPEADHTFSERSQQDAVENALLHWLDAQLTLSLVPSHERG